MPSLLELRGISKSFPGVRALADVTFACEAGEVHALVGENGAGKSTLIKILAGVYPSDAGAIRLRGRTAQITSPRDAQALGIAVIFQEFTLLPNLTVQENILLAREPTRRWGVLDYRRARRECLHILRRMRVGLSPDMPVAQLSVAEQQMVEICRALAQNASVLIMDEPTAALRHEQRQQLFALVRELQRRGVTVIYISHHLDEVFEVADRVTVLKDGRVVATARVPEVTKGQLIQWMIGRDLGEVFPAAPSASGAVVLEVRGLSRPPYFHDVTLTLRRGEIAGLAGLAGSGRTQFARAIAGLDPVDTGTILVSGRPLRPARIRDRLAAGVALVPEDRKREGLVLSQPMLHNVSLPVLGRLRAGLLVRRREEAALVSELTRRLDLRAAGLEQEVAFLSGGNQQKVVLARCLATNPSVLILDQPTRGVDIGAKAEIYRIIRGLADRGVAILMISEDLPEFLGLCDRVLVMRRGRLAGQYMCAGLTEELLLRAIYGSEDL